jgi:hypothetical protein
MKRYQKTAISQYLFVGLILLGILGFGLLISITMQKVSFDDYFILPWSAGRTWLLEASDPYGSISQNTQEVIRSAEYFAKQPSQEILLLPLFNLLLYLPFSLIPYGISRILWVTLLSIFSGGCVFLILRLSEWKLSLFERILAIIFGVFWYPGAYTILSGQLSPIILFIFLFAIVLLQNDQDTTAGLLLSLTFGSLPMAVIFTIGMLIWTISRRRWFVIIAYFSGVAFQIVISILLMPNWIMSWFNNIFSIYETIGWINTPLVSFAGLLPGISNFLVIFLHIIVGILLLFEIIMISRASGRVFIWRMFILLIISYFFHIQFSMAHLVLIIPGLFFVFRFMSERWGGWGRIFSWILLCILFVGSWFLFLPENRFTDSNLNPVLSIGLPVIVLMGLFYSRWWVHRIPKLDTGF